MASASREDDTPSASDSVPAQGEGVRNAEDAAADGVATVPVEEVMVAEEVLADARAHKERGNTHFKAQEFDAAIECYTQAIDVMPPGATELAVFFANRAACFARIGEHEGVVDDCTQALELRPQYTKALIRRALAREALDQPTEALEDAKAAAALDPADKTIAAAVTRLEAASAAKLEQQKEEMLGKLKDLGNSVLGRFGMSLDNFKAQKDPNTGSYNISFSQ